MRPDVLRYKILYLALSMAMLLAAGCGSKIELPDIPKPTQVTVSVTVSEDANPDPKGRILPIVVRLYQVKAPREFEQSDFFTLLDFSPSLANDGFQLIDELEMFGGQSSVSTHQLDPSVRYLGAMATYRQIDQSKWIGLVAMEPNAANAVEVKVERLKLTVSGRVPPNEE